MQASKLRSHTTITGFVSGELKLALLQDADLFVLPSYYENFGIAVAEAMVTATPVVISDQVHIWQEVHNAQAGWITEIELQSLTNSLKNALENATERKQKGANARKLALEKYSWNAIAQQMIGVYQQLTI